jgi:hypothetical protein
LDHEEVGEAILPPGPPPQGMARPDSRLALPEPDSADLAPDEVSAAGQPPCRRIAALMSLPTIFQSDSRPLSETLGFGSWFAKNRLAKLSPCKSPEVNDLRLLPNFFLFVAARASVLELVLVRITDATFSKACSNTLQFHWLIAKNMQWRNKKIHHNLPYTIICEDLVCSGAGPIMTRTQPYRTAATC